MLHGLFFEPPLEDNYLGHVLAEMYREKAYEPFLKGKKGLTVADFGANIGVFSYYIYPRAKKIYSVEPAKRHFTTMTHMFEFNKMLDKIVPLNYAIAKDNGIATFHHNPNKTMYSLSEAVQVSTEEVEEVRTVRIDTFFEENQIEYLDFLKLDVEGEEMNIVCGEGFEKIASKIGMVMGENHAWNGRNPNQLMTRFKDLGFDFQWIKNDAQLFVARRTNGTTH